MRFVLAAAAALIMASSSIPAASQTDSATSAQSSTSTTTTTSTVTATPMTKDQARQRIKDAGYVNVTALLKGADGVWHAKAMKDGQPHDVSLDLKGVVAAD